VIEGGNNLSWIGTKFKAQGEFEPVIIADDKLLT